jgi:GAF domain-containing protein
VPEDDLSATLVALHRYIAGDQTLGDTLTQVASLAMQALDAEVAGISMVDGRGRALTPVYTDETSPQIDQAQYDAGRGPCLDAHRTATILRIDDTSADERWPEFSEAARQHGIRSTISLPMVVGERAVGALNLYSREVARFHEKQEEWGMTFAGQAAIAVANANAYFEQADLAGNLRHAMASRAVIEQAKGVIMASMGVDADEAFEILRQQSQETNEKLREVAVTIVEQQRRKRS